jgi:hypothetical protein
MIKRSVILAMIIALYSTTSHAVPKDEEYSLCLSKTATDAGITACMKEEIEVVKTEISNTKKDLQYILRNQKGTDIKDFDIMEKKFNSYAQSYCLYNTIAMQGRGYSNDYLKSECELNMYLRYYRNLKVIYNITMTDIQG